MKLTLTDIRILTEGQQLEKAILLKYPCMSKAEAIGAFAELADRSPSSVDRYTRSSVIESKSFKLRAANLLEYDFKDIFLSEEEQLAIFINSITDNINEYTDNEDIKTLTAVKDICFEKSFKILLAQIYWCMALYHKNASRSDIAAEYVKFTISAYEDMEEQDKLRILRLKSELGLLYLLDGDYKSAIDVFERLIISEEHTQLLDTQDMFLIYYRLGICFLDLGEYNQARKYFEKAISCTDDTALKGHALKNIGIVYKNQRNFRKALDVYDEALKNFDLDIKNISMVLNNKAMLYREQGDLKSALKNINSAINMSKNEKEDNLKYNYLHTYTLIHIDIGSPIEALNMLLDATEKEFQFITYKKTIYLGVKTLLEYAFNNAEYRMVNRIQNTLIGLTNKTEDMQLKAFLGEVLIFKKEREVSI